MNFIKKNFLLITLLFTLLALPAITFAQGGGVGSTLQGQTELAGESAGYNVDEYGGPTGIARFAGNIVRAFLGLTGIIFMSYTVYGGFLWLTSGGNEERITKAKSIIRNGIIGLIVIFSAWAIYELVARVFSGPGSSSNSGSGAFGAQ